MASSGKTGYQYKEDGRFSNDNILNEINHEFVTLQKPDRKKCTENVEKVIKEGIIPLMKKDPFFAKYCGSILHGGSYYKGTKVGKANEYDLNLIINLPWRQDTLRFETPEKKPGFIKIQLTKESKLPDWDLYEKQLNKIISPDNYVDQNKFRELIESILTKSLQTLPEDPQFRKNGRKLVIKNTTYSVSLKKSGPAFTFTIKNAEKEIDVDLVPSLVFSVAPPKRYKGFSKGPVTKNWSIIPKPVNEDKGNLMWRVSFYREEMERLKGPMKTVIRLLKKLRNTQNMKNFASYFIETVGLNELRTYENDQNFLKLPLTCLFMHTFEKLLDAAKKHNIPFFYCKEMNLLYKIPPLEMKNYADRFAQIVSKINRNISEDSFIIARYILTHDELNALEQRIQSKQIEKEREEYTEQLKRGPPYSKLCTELFEKLEVSEKVVDEEKKNLPVENGEPESQFRSIQNLISNEFKKFHEMFSELKQDLKQVNDNVRKLSEKVEKLESRCSNQNLH